MNDRNETLVDGRWIEAVPMPTPKNWGWRIWRWLRIR